MDWGRAPDGMIYEIHENTDEVEGLDGDGRPDPAYAAALGLLQAPVSRRAAAVVSDALIWVLLQVPLCIGAIPLLLKLASGAISPYGFVNHPTFVFAVVMTAITVVLSLVFAIVQWVLHGRRGVTIGKSVFGVRSVNVRTLARPKVFPVFARFLVVTIAGVVPVIGPAAVLASSLLDPQRRGRGWHDKLSGVWVIDVRQGLNPYDEKRMRVARKMVKADPTPARAPLPSLATPDDPNAQPVYRPGSRVSAGVLGIARPHDANERPVVGLSQAVEPATSTTGSAGKPVLGGYRPAAAASSLRATPPAQAPPALPEAASAPAVHGHRPDSAHPAVATNPAPPAQPAPISRRDRSAAARLAETPLEATALAAASHPDPAAHRPAAALPPGTRLPALPPGVLPQALTGGVEPAGALPTSTPSRSGPPASAASSAHHDAPQLRRPRRTAQATDAAGRATGPEGVADPASAAPGPRRGRSRDPAGGAGSSAVLPQAAHEFGLRFDSGEVVAVSTALVLGRNPDASAYPGARAHPLADDTRSLSKTHLLVRPVGGGVEVTDCGSSNGSCVRRGDARRDLTAGEALVLAAGDVIRLGDRSAVVISR